MFIALTGLHSAGKSYLAHNIISKYGFEVCSKKELVHYICDKLTDRYDWAEWYREEFNKDAEKMTKLILSYLNLENNIALDAVHSDLEWGIIKSVIPDAELIGVITPEFIREKRREIDDLEKDKKRIGYWHNGGGCLMTEVSWTMNGGASLEINEKLFREFLEYKRKKELLEKGKDVSFSDDKVKKLQSLIFENQLLGEKIEIFSDAVKKIEENKNNTEEQRYE